MSLSCLGLGLPEQPAGVFTSGLFCGGGLFWGGHAQRRDSSPRHHSRPEFLFWAIRRNGTVGHTGGDAGLSAFLFFDPATRTGKIFLTNTEIHSSPRSSAQLAAIWKLLDGVR